MLSVTAFYPFLSNGLTEARRVLAGPARLGCKEVGPVEKKKGAGPAYLLFDCLVALLQPAPPPPHVLPVEDRYIWRPGRATPAQPPLWPAGEASRAASPPPSHRAAILPFQLGPHPRWLACPQQGPWLSAPTLEEPRPQRQRAKRQAHPSAILPA